MVTRYLIEASQEQLDGLKHACAFAETEHARSIPENQRAVAQFQQRQDTEFENMARQNLEHARSNLRLVRLASSALYRAKIKPTRTGSARLATPSLVAGHETTAAAEPLPSGSRGTTPPEIDPAGGTLECRNSLWARALTAQEDC
jgi:hypothetical protein